MTNETNEEKKTRTRKEKTPEALAFRAAVLAFEHKPSAANMAELHAKAEAHQKAFLGLE